MKYALKTLFVIACTVPSFGFVTPMAILTPNYSSVPVPVAAADVGRSMVPFSLYSTAQTVQQDVLGGQQVLALTLEKPLGMILEEVEEGQAKGVFVLELAENGSAATCDKKDQLVGLTIATVMGEDVMKLAFDDVMEKLINAPSPVSLQLVSLEMLQQDKHGEENEAKYVVGTPVTITVMENGKETLVEAKVGDNLRKTLLENNIEVYKGLKKKLGNCGGGGQCTFCAADFLESKGWEPRSEYEDQKLKKSPIARLTCLNSIQGPAIISLS